MVAIERTVSRLQGFIRSIVTFGLLIAGFIALFFSPYKAFPHASDAGIAGGIAHAETPTDSSDSGCGGCGDSCGGGDSCGCK